MRISSDRFYLEISGGHSPDFRVTTGRTATNARTVLVRAWKGLLQVAFLTTRRGVK